MVDLGDMARGSGSQASAFPKLDLSCFRTQRVTCSLRAKPWLYLTALIAGLAAVGTVLAPGLQAQFNFWDKKLEAYLTAEVGSF